MENGLVSHESDSQGNVEVALQPPVTLSIVTTAHNESGNVASFFSEVREALHQLGVTAEIVYFDDGSTDGTGETVLAVVREYPDLSVRLIRHGYRMGISKAIEESCVVAKGQYVCFLPADLESLPSVDIPLLYHAMDGETDVAVGWRKDRRDGKLLASQFANLLNYWFFNLKLHDANWIKLIRREKLQGLQLRSDWHRFFCAILAHRGCRFKEVETVWHSRSYGRSKFGVGRIPVSLADLITLKFLLSYEQRPMLFFGTVGVLALLWALIFFLGSICFADLRTSRLGLVTLVFSGMWAVVSLGSFGVGLLAELVLTVGKHQKASRSERM